MLNCRVLAGGTANSTASDWLCNSDCKNGTCIANRRSGTRVGNTVGGLATALRAAFGESNGVKEQQNALDSGGSFLLITYLRKACV